MHNKPCFVYYSQQTLTCLPTTPAGGTFTTRTGNLIVRLDKGSGSTKAYSFNLILTTIEGKSTRFDTLTPGRSWQVLSRKLPFMLDESLSEKCILEINKRKQTLVALFLC